MAAMGALGDAGGLVRLLANGATVRGQLAVANGQAATGRIAETYAGLGAGGRVSLDLRPQVAHEEGWQANISAATGRLAVTQDALKSIGAIASDLYARTNTLNGLNEQDVTNVATLARQGLERVAQLLNTKVGNVYVFAGQDTDTPPVPDTSPGVLATALLASDTDPAPFDPTLGTAVPSIEVGEGERVPVGVLANRNTLAVSAPPSTGSYMRDILRELAVLSTLSSGPGLQATAADARTRLGRALSTLGMESGSLGNIQAGLATRQAQSAATVLALRTQVSGAEDVDLAAALTKVSGLQTQLQASYQVIAGRAGPDVGALPMRASPHRFQDAHVVGNRPRRPC